MNRTFFVMTRFVCLAAALLFAAPLLAQWTSDTNGYHAAGPLSIGRNATTGVALQLAGTPADSPTSWLLTFGTTTQNYYGIRTNSSNQLVIDRNDGGTWKQGLVYGSNGVLDFYSVPANDGVSSATLRLFDTSDVAQGVGSGIAFMAHASSAPGAYTTFASIKGIKDSSALSDYRGAVSVGICNPVGSAVKEIARFGADATVVNVTAGTGLQEVARFANTGTTITGNLQVNGTVTGTNISAQYQDLAEWVPATGEVAAGTVVVVDPMSEGVTPSSSAYQTSVAGVASPKPGLILGVPGPDKAQIATTGRVRIKVDATRAPIHRGDLLVSSEKPGRAMRSEPVMVNGVAMHRPGTVIGKALEPLESGEGEILVLLSLQ